MTRARIRRTIDFGRIREGAAGPGADPRSWVVTARVDNDPDAIRWEPPYGWIADVTVQGGPLDQEGPIPCRVATTFGSGEGAGRLEPIARGAEVLVTISEGDPNANPVIVGQLLGVDTAPSSVNGTPIDEAAALGTHILVTPHAVDEEIGGTRRVKTGDTHRILGPLIELADENATRSFVRGEDLQSAIDTYGQDILLAFQALVPPGLPATPVTGAQAAAAVVQATTALVKLQAAAASYLSARVKAE